MYNFAIIVEKAQNLPKMDGLLGKIDAYVKFPNSLNKENQKNQTGIVKQNLSPVWKEQIHLVEKFHEPIKVEVWDWDKVGSDDLAAECWFNPNELFEKGRLEIELHTKKKTKKPPTLTLLKTNCRPIKTFEQVIADFKNYQVQHYADYQNKSVYLPLRGMENAVDIRIKWEKNGKLDMYLLAKTEGLWLDWIQTTPNSALKVIRKTETFTGPHGVSYTQYAKLDDVKSTTDFNTISFVVSLAKQTDTGTLDQIASHHNWKGSLTYSKAKNTLTDVWYDDTEEEIFFPLCGCLGQCPAYFVCDWDKGNVDMKMAIMPGAHNIAFDLTLADKKVEKKSCYYSSNKQVCGGKVWAQRILKLDDCKYGVALKNFKWIRYDLSNHVQMAITGVVGLY